ncbi:hypothetical protein MPSEU_000575700 [Mayamaea pseudoterrestris]|nr:hypothetical protein MPSEU_000575700 [Mayamaea pseudoterrestris]
MTSNDPASRWCCVAEIDAASASDEVIVSEVTAWRIIMDGRTLDITTSPGWMEYLERKEDRLDDEGGAGAYDTMRCDFILNGSDQDSKDRWRIWGEEFHINRLQNSFRALLNDKYKNVSFDRALQQSRTIIKHLLAQAESSVILLDVPFNKRDSNNDDVEIQLIRLTLLWSLDNLSGIIVRGHACSTAKPMFVRSSVQPIVAAIAARCDDKHHISIDDHMPTRSHNAQCKIASWTRLRQQMEQPLAYKPAGVAEVLMVRPLQNNEMELLEGSSSNVLVVYKDGSPRTAPHDVLSGYVRNLVLECAPACGLRLDPSPILLSEVDQWEEVIITSSTRLIYPISSILIQMGIKGGSAFDEFWSYRPTTVQADEPSKRAKWRHLLDELLHRNGYPRQE